MNESLKSLLGEGPYPFPVSEQDSNSPVNIYHGAGAAIIETNPRINFPRGVHTHDSYEFVIPFTNMPSSRAGSRTVAFEKNKLLPFNPNQEHGPTAPMDNCGLLGLQIDNMVVSAISHSISGKNELIFQNESVKPDNELYHYLGLFMEETKMHQAGYEFVLQGLVNQIVVSLIRQLKSNITPLLKDHNYCDKDSINRVIAYLREHYNKEYSLEDVAQIANLSPYHFIRVFKSTTGKTPYDYLLDIKIEKACLLLRNKNMTVTEICFLCGFHNLEHFASVFKRKTGMLPSYYKNNT